MVSPGIRRIFLTNLIFQVLIVLSGGIVRLSGSGLGCTTAPECVPGSIVPLADQNEGIYTAIEFSNRVFSVLVGFAAIAAVIAAWRSHRRALLQLAGVPLIVTLAQGILGGITVQTGLHPAIVMAHFLLSAILIAASTLLYVRSKQPEGRPQVIVRREVWWLIWGLLASLVLVVVAGTITTGTGPHAGDADNPPRFDFDLTFVTHLHAEVGIAFSVLALAVAVSLRLIDAPRRAREAAGWLMGAVVLQVTIGYMQVLSGLPIVLVALHMLAASLLIVTTFMVFAEVRRVPINRVSKTEVGKQDAIASVDAAHN